MTAEQRKQNLQIIWQAALAAVSGEQAVHHAIEADIEADIKADTTFQPDQIIAIGKAAVGMCRGALHSYPNCNALVVTKYQHADTDLLRKSNLRVIEAAHPIPDQQSLVAGAAILDCVRQLPAHSELLLLVSGGASALAESLPDHKSLADLQAITNAMIASGKTIDEINQTRKTLSLLKDGKLLAAFGGAKARVYAISDVEGDGIATIGSGIGDCHRATVPTQSSIIASNQIARQGAVTAAQALGLTIRHNAESLYGDVFDLASMIGKQLTAPAAQPGVYIWGGEPTITLPENPGCGGRNQTLALATAEHLLNQAHITLLVAGTDGSDGPTNAAGGLVDQHTFIDAVNARQRLRAADAGTYLAQHNSLFVTGPTHTNVMDLAIAIVGE